MLQFLNLLSHAQHSRGILNVILLWSPYRIGQTIIFCPVVSSFFLLFFLTYSQPSQTGCLPYFHTWCGISANLRCRSETCCTRLSENTGRKKVAKNRHLGTIAKLCRAISSQLRHVSTIGKKIVKQQYLLHTSSQYGEFQPTNGWDRLTSLGHHSKFQLVSLLGSITAWHLIVGVSQTLRRWTEGATYIRQGDQRRPSCWALAHISSIVRCFLAVHMMIVCQNNWL